MCKIRYPHSVTSLKILRMGFAKPVSLTVGIGQGTELSSGQRRVSGLRGYESRVFGPGFRDSP